MRHPSENPFKGCPVENIADSKLPRIEDVLTFRMTIVACEHMARKFNGYVWRCRDCGKVLERS